VNKSTIILTILLVASVAAIPVAYTMGRESAADELRDEFETALNEVETSNDVYLQTMDDRLSSALAEWNLKHRDLESRFREAMLNTGVPLEVLDAEIVEPEVVENFIVPQDTYVAIKKGMTYDEVITLVGREGENSLNLTNADGSGLRSFSWRWVSEEGTEEQMNVTFDGNIVTDKHYTDFKL